MGEFFLIYFCIMLQVKNLSFGYNNDDILSNISLEINKGDHVSIIGESGSGKSTLLKLIYGEFDLNSGQIFWNNHQILGPKYNLVVGYHFIKYLSQEFDLMPFTSVEENVGHYLSNFFPEKKLERISELLEVVELQDFSKSKVKLLSGGQKQRVALARALAKNPELILLDEPFSHIDNFKKHSLRRKLFKYFKKQGITCIVATHDKEDVLGYSDKIIVLNNKRVISQGTPQKLYRNPKTPVIASFFSEYNVIAPYGIVYTHQLKISENGQIQASIEESYFRGRYYLIEALYKGNLIYFEHDAQLKKHSLVNLEIISI